MENIIYNELITRGYSVDVGVVEVYENDEVGKRHKVACEIDFVVNRGAKKYYIQSALCKYVLLPTFDPIITFIWYST